MSNRFSSKEKDRGYLKDILLPIATFALIGGLFYYGLGTVNQTTDAERLRSVQQAVTKATVQCYAIEGQYPPNLKYLEEHYGLALDTDRYIVQYDIFASNIMPTILVLPRDFSMTGGTVDENEF